MAAGEMCLPARYHSRNLSGFSPFSPESIADRSSGNLLGSRLVVGRHHRSEVSPMTIQHHTWLAHTVAGSVLLIALYLVLLEFSQARLP